MRAPEQNDVAARVRTWCVVAAVLGGILVGCNSGSRSSSAAPVGGGTLSYATVNLTSFAQTSQVVGRGFVPVFTFTLSAAGGPVTVSQLQFAASGTARDQDFDGAQLYQDTNADGVIGAGDPLVASVATTFTADNGSFVFPVSPPLQIPAGSTVQLMLFLDADTIPANTAVVGSNIAVVVSTTSFQATDGAGVAVVPSGAFVPSTNPVTLGINDHLVISEVSPFGNEFIEIYNPTGGTIALTSYSLTNVTSVGNQNYFNLPTAANFGPPDAATTAPPSSSTFIVFFPAGATINPGEFRVIAVDGDTQPTGGAQFALRDFVGTAAQMRTWKPGSGGPVPFTDPVFSLGEVEDTAVLDDAGQTVVLFFWDGASDTVIDIDIVNYGATPNPVFPPVNKTGVSIDGPDNNQFAGTDVTAYVAETPSGQRAAVGTGNSAQRNAGGFDEVGATSQNEVRGTGNGFAPGTAFAHDETSELFTETFTPAAPSPGTAP